MTELLLFLLSFLPITNPIDPNALTCIQGKTNFDCWIECYYSDGRLATNNYCAYNGDQNYTCTKCTHTDALGGYCTVSNNKKCPYG